MTSLRVLVIEDEAIAAMYIQIVLESAGYTIVGIEMSGEQAILNASNSHPDLALVDINLQGEMNGLQAARILHERYGVRSLFLTACSLNEVMAKDPELDPADVLTKPVSPDKLLKRIRELMKA